MVKAGCNDLGINAIMTDLGHEPCIVLCSDSSAAKGIANRRGLGKLRHIELSELWLQDQVNRGRIVVAKCEWQ